MNASEPLNGRTAVVTGGTRGIGWEIASRLRDDGADVMVTGANPDGAGPGDTRFYAVNFTEESAVDAFAEELRGNAPDILVNNAGLNRNAPFADIDLDDFDAIHLINLRAPVAQCRQFSRRCAKTDGAGWSISDDLEQTGETGARFYAASKFGLDGVTAAAAAERPSVYWSIWVARHHRYRAHPTHSGS